MSIVKNLNNKQLYQSSGRRKTATAQLSMSPGQGIILVNKKPITTFFPYQTLVQNVIQPLMLTDNLENYDINLKVKNGGFSGQAGAARLAIAKALLLVSVDYRPILRQKNLLTRDNREKERRKCGLKKARKAPQFSKR